MKNPPLKVQPSAVDYGIGIAALLITTTSLVLPLIYSNEVPGKVPTHYNLSGQPDAWNEHGSLWLFPVIGLILFIGFTVLNSLPFIYRYPVKVTDANAHELYRLGARTVRILKLLTALMLFFLTCDTIKAGSNQSAGSSGYYLALFFVACTILVAAMISKMKTK